MDVLIRLAAPLVALLLAIGAFSGERTRTLRVGAAFGWIGFEPRLGEERELWFG